VRTYYINLNHNFPNKISFQLYTLSFKEISNMKKRMVSILAVVVVLALVAGVVAAQTGIPGSGWWTGEQVQNVGTSTANIVVTAYDKNGSLTYTTSQTATVGSTVGLTPNNFAGMPSGFIGSAVVSSDQPIKAVVNVSNVFNGTFGVQGGKAQALYQGTESPDTKLYFPMAKNNRFGNSTAFYVQNAGTAAASVTAVFKMDTGSPTNVYTYTIASLDPNKMAVINPVDASVPSAGGTGGRDNIGSLTVSSAQPLAGTVLEYKQGQTIATILGGTRGFTAANFDTKTYAPTIKNDRFGRFTGIQVQNASANPVNVTVVYIGSAGVCAGGTYTDTTTGLQPGSSKTFNQLVGQSALPANCTAAATVSATGTVIATINETNMSNNANAALSTLSAQGSSQATTKISVPQFKDQRFGATTGLMIENVGTATASIVATFSCRGGATFTAISVPRTAPVGGAIQFFKPSNNPAWFSTPFPSKNVVCGVTITADQPIVATANEQPDTVGAFDDNNYEGFNLVP